MTRSAPVDDIEVHDSDVLTARTHSSRVHPPNLLSAPTPKSFASAPPFPPASSPLLDFVEPSATGPVKTANQHVVRGSAWFVAAVGIGAVFSFVFWGIAAHVTDKTVLDDGARLIAFVQCVNFLTGMGLPIAVARFGSVKKQTVWVLFMWALIYTTIASFAGMAIFGIAAPEFVKPEYLEPLFQWGTPFGLLLFFLLIAGMSFALLVEVRLVTMRKWRWVLGRVLAYSILRMPFLLVPTVMRSPIGIVLLVVGLPALSGLVGVAGLSIVTKKRDKAPLFPLPAECVPAFRYASVNYFGMLAAQAPQFALPVIVAANTIDADYGAFFIAWQVTVVVFLIPHTIGQVVLAEGSRKRTPVAQQVRSGLKISLGLMIIATAVTLFGAKAGLVTVAFGKHYQLSADLLPRFVGAGIPWAVTSICLARARLAANHARTILITAGFAVFTLAPTIFMTSRSGTVGAANAWLIGNMIAAATAVLVTAWVRQPAKSHLIPSAGMPR